MKSDVLKSVVDGLINKFYSFAYALIPDELQAEQLVIDSYSTFLIKHKKDIQHLDAREGDTRVKFYIRKLVYKKMMTTIYQLAVTRFTQLKINPLEVDERYRAFYGLTQVQRAVMHLQEVLEMSHKDICEVMQISSHQTLEHVYNAQISLQNQMPKESLSGV